MVQDLKSGPIATCKRMGMLEILNMGGLKDKQSRCVGVVEGGAATLAEEGIEEQEIPRLETFSLQAT